MGTGDNGRPAVRRALKEFEVPEWGRTVYLRPLLLEERSRLADLAPQFDGMSNEERMRKIILPVLADAVCDESGKPLYTLEELREETRWLDLKTVYALQHAIVGASGLTPEARTELEKNSPGAPSGEPGSA
jgi:hypothetical protein